MPRAKRGESSKTGASKGSRTKKRLSSVAELKGILDEEQENAGNPAAAAAIVVDAVDADEADLQQRTKKRQSLARRRRSSIGAALLTAAARPALERPELSSLYQRCIQLSTENKITQKNSWNLRLLDYLDDVMQQDAEDADEGAGHNFQKASSTLDASVKIFSCRVDAVHSDTFRVLGGLSRTAAGADDDDDDKKKRRKRGKDGEGDDGDGDGDDEEEEEGAEWGRQGVKGAKDGKAGDRRRTRAEAPTLAQSAQIDAVGTAEGREAVGCVDPLFVALSARMEGAGVASGLMYQLGVDARGRGKFFSWEAPKGEQQQQQLEEQEEKEEQEEQEENFDAVVDSSLLKLLPGALGAGAPRLCASLAGFAIGRDSFASEDAKKKKEKEEEADEEEKGEEQEEQQDEDGGPVVDGALSGAVDWVGAAEEVQGLEFGGFDGGAEGGDDDDAFDGFGGGSGGYFAPEGDDEGAEAERAEAAERAAARRRAELAGSRGLLWQVQLAGSAWAGPQHWRFQRKKGQNGSSSSSSSSSTTARGKRSKAPFFIDFTGALDEKKLTASRAATTLPAAQRRLDFAQTTLPRDHRVDAKAFQTLFTRPQYRFHLAHEPPVARVPVAAFAQTRMGLLGKRAPTAPSYAEDADADAEGFDDGGFGAFDGFDGFEGGDGFDGFVGGEALQASESAFLGAAMTSADAAAALVEAPRRPETIRLQFAKVAKNVDVKQLKRTLWKEIAEERRALRAGREEETPEEGALSFQRVLKRIPQHMRKERALEETSVSYCFICLLHLANEQGVLLEQPDGMRDDILIQFPQNEQN